MNFLGTIVYDEEIGKALEQQQSVVERPYSSKARDQLCEMYTLLIEQI